MTAKRRPATRKARPSHSAPYLVPERRRVMARPPKTSPTVPPVASAACRTSARRVSTSSRTTAGQASHRKRRVARCRARSRDGGAGEAGAVEGRAQHQGQESEAPHQDGDAQVGQPAHRRAEGEGGPALLPPGGEHGRSGRLAGDAHGVRVDAPHDVPVDGEHAPDHGVDAGAGVHQRRFQRLHVGGRDAGVPAVDALAVGGVDLQGVEVALDRLGEEQLHPVRGALQHLPVRRRGPHQLGVRRDGGGRQGQEGQQQGHGQGDSGAPRGAPPSPRAAAGGRTATAQSRRGSPGNELLPGREAAPRRGAASGWRATACDEGRDAGWAQVAWVAEGAGGVCRPRLRATAAMAVARRARATATRAAKRGKSEPPFCAAAGAVKEPETGAAAGAVAPAGVVARAVAAAPRRRPPPPAPDPDSRCWDWWSWRGPPPGSSSPGPGAAQRRSPTPPSRHPRRSGRP